MKIRINGYDSSLSLSEAVRRFRCRFPLPLKQSIRLLQEVGIWGYAEFEIDRMPGAKLALLSSDGFDVELINPPTTPTTCSIYMCLTDREADILADALNAHREHITKNPEWNSWLPDQTSLEQKLREGGLPGTRRQYYRHPLLDD